MSSRSRGLLCVMLLLLLRLVDEGSLGVQVGQLHGAQLQLKSQQLKARGKVPPQGSHAPQLCKIQRGKGGICPALA